MAGGHFTAEAQGYVVTGQACVGGVVVHGVKGENG